MLCNLLYLLALSLHQPRQSSHAVTLSHCNLLYLFAHTIAVICCIWHLLTLSLRQPSHTDRTRSHCNFLYLLTLSLHQPLSPHSHCTSYELNSAKTVAQLSEHHNVLREQIIRPGVIISRLYHETLGIFIKSKMVINPSRRVGLERILTYGSGRRGSPPA